MAAEDISLIYLITVLIILPASQVLTANRIDQPERSAYRREKRETNSGQELIKRMLINYDHTVSPNSAGTGKPTDVKLGVFLVTMKFPDKTDFEATLYFRQSWTDHRLQFKHVESLKDQSLYVMNEEIDRIWKPDTFFRSSTEVKEHEITSRNALFRIASDGGIWHVRLLTVRGSCRTAVHRYPIDQRTCTLRVESFGRTAKDLTLSSLTPPLEVDSSIDFGGWHLTGTVVVDCTQNYTAGVFPCLEFSMRVKRLTGYYILKIYAPSTLLVLLSWLPLWMGAGHQMIMRLVLGISAQLGLIFLGSTAYEELPEISYVTAMHVWMGFSHLMVFLSIVKVIFFGGQGQANAEDDEKEHDGATNRKTGGKLGQISQRIDLISKFIFPAVFLLFNIVYWIVYKA